MLLAIYAHPDFIESGMDTAKWHMEKQDLGVLLLQESLSGKALSRNNGGYILYGKYISGGPRLNY